MNFDVKDLRTVVPIKVEDLRRLHTGTVLSRLKALQSLQESFELSDWTEEEKDAVARAGLIAFKDTPEWREAFDDVKAVLATREHVPRGSKEQRQQAAKKKKYR